jgi:hypothetical protein
MIRWTLMLVTLGLLLAAPAAFAIEGDYNGDGAVDENDRAIVTAAVGTVAGDPDFVAAADHDGDGIISLQDVGYFLRLTQQ